MSAEADVATELNANVVALTLGGNLRIGEVLPATKTAGVTNPIPQECVFVSTPVGGAAPLLFRDGGAGGGILRRVVQVTVRSAQNDYTGGRTLADQTFAGIHLNPPSGYIDAKVRGSEPSFIGRDDRGSLIWTFNVDLTGGS